jgi:hypothetical protein
MAITFVGASTQAVSSTSGAIIAGTWPSGYTAVADDVAFIVVAGRHNAGTSLAPSTPSGYTQLATEFSEVGTYDLQLTVFYKVLTAGESAAPVTVPSAYSTTSGGLSRTVLVYRSMNTTSLIDASAVVSDSNSTTATTFQPTGVTTNSAEAMVISFVATSDDNALNLSSAQSFTLRVSGIDYDTTVGGDHAIGVADRIIATASTPTMPTWNMSVGAPDYWAAITASFSDGTPTTLRTASASGIGSSSATALVTRIRTATTAAIGTATAVVPPVSFTDNFTRADSTTSIGANWIVRAGTLGITSNQGYPVTATATATQPIQSSAFKQVVRVKIVADPAVNSPVNVLIAWKDSNNYVAAVRSQPFATWVLVSVTAGVTTNHGNTGLSATTNVWVHVVRDGNTFQMSAQSTTAGATQTRSSTFTISGFDYNDVGFLFPSSGTAYTVDDFSARPFDTTTRTTTSSGTGTTATAELVTRPRTATATATGSSTAAGTVVKLRTAASSGTGSSTATGAVIPITTRTASSTGSGASTAAGLVTRLQTATAASAGSSTVVGVVVKLRTALANAQSISDATRVVVKLRTALAAGQGSSTAVGSLTVVVARTASSAATGTATATGSLNPAIDRTATASAAGSSTATRTIVRRRTATAAGLGTATAAGQRTAEIQRQGVAVGISSEETVSVALPRPLNPPRTPRQALRRSRLTTIVADTPTLVVPRVLDIQPIQPTLVFDREADDEIMLCLA